MRSWVVAFAIVFLASGAFAGASETELETARRLFDEGLALEDAHDFAHALDKFQRVAAIKATPQVRYNLGVCFASTGKLVEASNEWGRVVAEARDSNDPELRKLASLAETRRAEIDPRIPRIIVRVPEGATITLDGAPVDAALAGSPLLVNPGPHDLIAKSPTGETKARHIDATPANPPPEIELTPEAHAPDMASITTRPVRWYAFTSGGATLAAFGVALGMFAWRADGISHLDSICGADRQSCPQSARSDVDRVSTQTTVANVMLAAGIVGVVVTVVLFVVRPRKTTFLLTSGLDATLRTSF